MNSIRKNVNEAYYVFVQRISILKRCIIMLIFELNTIVFVKTCIAHFLNNVLTSKNFNELHLLKKRLGVLQIIFVKVLPTK